MAPAGMMAFFKLSECPDGWIVYSNAQGRLIHSVTNSSHINLTLGDPLPDLTPPTHSHNVSSNITIPAKAISLNFLSSTLAGSGTASYSIHFPSPSPTYPFVHLLLCRLVNETFENVPTGIIAFFDNDTCPTNWNPYSESIGRFIIPGSSKNGVVYSTASPLNSLEDRLHSHHYNTAFTTKNKGYYHLADTSSATANPNTYLLSGTTSQASSGFPYIQLLTCRSNEGGEGTDLPLGIHLFYSNGFCDDLSGNLWQEADSNITGHWIISLPENGTVGTSFGGNSWIVTSTSGRDGMGHGHAFNGSITLKSITINLGSGSSSYVQDRTYNLLGTSGLQDFGLPYLSMPMCALAGIPSPSPSPVHKSSGDSGFKITNMWIGIIAGVGGLLLLSAILVAVFLKKRRGDKLKEMDSVKRMKGFVVMALIFTDDYQHYTISISLGTYADSSISISNIQITEKLGGGNFGEVFKGLWNGTTPVALKKLKSREQLEEFAQEAKVLLSLNHPNIVRCLGIHTSQNGDQYIVMEYLSKGSLDNVLKKEPNLKIGDLLIMSKHAAAGMLYLEQQRLVHRDLALRNLLVAHEVSNYSVKVSDFGLSRKIQEDGYYMKLDTQGIPIRWTAPEVFEKGLYTTKSDVWSFGITLWELFSFGQTPYADMTNFEVMQQVVAGYHLGCPKGCPKEIHDLMLHCWQKIPEKRPGFKEIYDIIETVSKDSKQSLQWAQHEPTSIQNNNRNTKEIYHTNQNS